MRAVFTARVMLSFLAAYTAAAEAQGPFGVAVRAEHALATYTAAAKAQRPFGVAVRAEHAAKRFLGLRVGAPRVLPPAALALAELFQTPAGRHQDDKLDQAKVRVSSVCRRKYAEHGATPQQCRALLGRTCASSAVFVQEPSAVAQHKNLATNDLHAQWDWCFPRDCADTRDLLSIGVFVQNSLVGVTVPRALNVSLTIDCSQSGGAFVQIVSGESPSFKGGAARSTLFAAAAAALLAPLLWGWT